MTMTTRKTTTKKNRRPSSAPAARVKIERRLPENFLGFPIVAYIVCDKITVLSKIFCDFNKDFKMFANNNSNAIAPVQNDNYGAPALEVGGYQSPFMQVRSIAELKMAAQVFASSDFAPKSFQGNVGNCMVALDMANQLGMNVLTLMQQLYVIDGRPAVSTALANSLFNMAQGKKFSTIRLERGVDGMVEYDVMVKEKDARGYTTYRPSGKKKSLPNYWAVAYTTNLKTGERFESPKVSVQTALDNGWLTKYQSKWQTLPELMCGYRAQAFLIRTYFPQVLLGVYFQDEMEDIAADKQQVAVEVVQPVSRQTPYQTAQPPQIEAVDRDEETALADEISAAKTLDELKVAGGKVKNYALSPQAKDRLRSLYAQRNKELSETTVQTVEVESAVEAVEEKKPSRRTSNKKSQPDAFNADDFTLRVKNAATEEELAVLYAELKDGVKSERIATELAERLENIIESRYIDFENAAPSGNDNSSDREANVYDLIREVNSQSDSEGLKRAVDKAAAWRNSGDIDEDGFSRVVEAAQKRGKSFNG